MGRSGGKNNKKILQAVTTRGSSNQREEGQKSAVSLETYFLEQAGWSKEDAEDSPPFVVIRKKIEELLEFSEKNGEVRVDFVEEFFGQAIGELLDMLQDLSEEDMTEATSQAEEIERQKKYQALCAAIYSIGDENQYGFEDLIQEVRESVIKNNQENKEKGQNFAPPAFWIGESHLDMGQRELAWERFQDMTGLKPADSQYEYIDYDDYDFPEVFEIKDGKLYPKPEENSSS